jgi:hypothetical protein
VHPQGCHGLSSAAAFLVGVSATAACLASPMLYGLEGGTEDMRGFTRNHQEECAGMWCARGIWGGAANGGLGQGCGLPSCDICLDRQQPRRRDSGTPPYGV